MEIDKRRYLELSLPQRRKDVENELRWLLTAASTYARSGNSAAFRERQNARSGNFFSPITREDVDAQTGIFMTVFTKFFDEVEALRAITSGEANEQMSRK